MSDKLPQKPRVLVCPLDWGLGHASRCIPVIRKLQHAGFEVLVAADGRALALLEKECNDLIHIRFPGFSPRFSSGSGLILKTLSWIPSILWHTIREHRTLSHLVEAHEISVVISDNRFGLYTSKAICVFITHQVMIKAPRILSFAEKWLYRINRFFINKYDYCWIPDLPGSDNLAGDLSHRYSLPLNAHFIGLLSRFVKNSASVSPVNGPLLAILSGPEPQRTILEEMILSQLENLDQAATIVRGTPENNLAHGPAKKIRMLAHLESGELAEAIARAGVIVCRSGYSSLMDMAVLGKKAVLVVPTPGQTEQEYLAERVQEKGWFIAQTQQNFDLHKAIAEADRCTGITIQTDETLLDGQISVLNRLLKDLPVRR